MKWQCVHCMVCICVCVWLGLELLGRTWLGALGLKIWSVAKAMDGGVTFAADNVFPADYRAIWIMILALWVVSATACTSCTTGSRRRLAGCPYSLPAPPAPLTHGSMVVDGRVALDALLPTSLVDQ